MDIRDILNTGFVCSSHTQERKDAIRANIEEVISMLEAGLTSGKEVFAKFDFKQEGFDTENMWVKVAKINKEDETIIGTLNNVPLFLTNVKFGKIVTRSFNDIMDITI